MSQKIAIRLNGGPFEGTRVSDGPWPPPETLEDPELRGRYIKIRQSQLPDDFFDSPHVMRGAEYQWEEAE